MAEDAPAWRVCVLVALLSAVLILGWQELEIRYQFHGQQSGLFQAGDYFPAPPPLRSFTYVLAHSTGYDGQFYRYVAHDPFFRRGFSAWMDDARHRYGRILVPLIAYAIAGGDDARIDRAYQFVVAIFLALGVYWLARYFADQRRSAWWGLGFLLVPAAIASFDRMVVDGALCALFAGFLFHLRRENWKALYALALVAPLVRDTGIFIVAGVVIAALVRRRWKLAALFATAAIPFLLWSYFVRERTRPSMALGIVTRPVYGVILRAFTFRDYPAPAAVRLTLWTTEELAIVGYIACLVMAAVWAWRTRGEQFPALEVTIALFVVLGCLLGSPIHLDAAYGYARPLSPLLLWLMLDAVSRRAWMRLAAPLAVTLAVGVYLARPIASVIAGMLS